jgi:PKD repeat protein
LTAQFTDANSGAIAWLWNFGDGHTSALQNPTHVYTLPGHFTVSLTTTFPGGGCQQTINNFNTFNVGGGYAGFSSASSPCPPYVTNFTDSSLNAVSWYWEFDDGTTSTAQNPSHVFANPGYHSAALTITTADGCSYSTMQRNGIYFTPFGANFYGVPLDTVFPMPVQFYANSIGATTWLWNFGDTGTSNLENPLHTFQLHSLYNVTLTISNGNCTLTYTPPPFDFGNPDTSQISQGNGYLPLVQDGCAPLSITFTRKIVGSVSWLWEFGDGDTSHQEFPSHLYSIPGYYSVTLTTRDSSGNSNVLQMDSIVHAYGPIAGFTESTTLGCANTQIAITDTSSYATKWFWDMGDGTTDTIRNPFHAYPATLSNYVITETVSDSGGCSASVSKSIFSNPTSPLLASETEVCGLDTIYFYTSIQNCTSYFWDFGDGNTSTQVNPQHLYLAEGTYNVSLTVTDRIGCIHTYLVSPSITVNLPTADFTTTGVRKGCDQLDIHFVNNSQNADSYLWNFGDGSTSTQSNPVHNYLQAGTYSVSLTVYRGSCIVTKSEPDYIRVDTAYAYFTYSTNQVCIPIHATFQDLSLNPVSWKWYFGDGDSSTVQNPVHDYPVRPCCFPSIIMTDINGCTDTFMVPRFQVFRADFSTSSDSGCTPSTIHFRNNSSPMADSWYWDFGDGSTSTLQNPAHTYTQPGEYDIMLVIRSVSISCPDTLFLPAKIKIRQPHADFISTDIPNCAPSIVNFTNSSMDGTNYLWDFGDGGTSTNRNATHIYNSPGIFDVSLVITNGLGCADSITKQHYIKVLGPITNFSVSSTQGCPPLQVVFTDHSINAVTYSWNFGDGYSDYNQNTTHTFLDSGTFTASLVTKDTSGCISFFELPQPITILPKPDAGFTVSAPGGCIPFTEHFTNTSTGFQSIYWNFMDGNTSAANNPSHQYTTAGHYDVQLIAYNHYGCADTAQLPQPVNAVPFPHPSFYTNDTLGCAPLYVAFHNQSVNLEGPQYVWDFGNGTTSTDANPIYVYPYPGSFDVKLTVTNMYGCSDSLLFPSLIHPQDSTPPNETNILSVSVENNTSVKIIWENNPAVDLASYVLFRLDPQMNFFRPVFTQPNTDNTNFALTSEYTDIGLNTLQNTYTYKIQAIDVCGNTIPLELLKAHTTINISSHASGESILVDWTPYMGCPVNTYELYRAAPGEQFQYLSSLLSTANTYTDTTFICPLPYSYKVMATDLCGNIYTSYSDTSVTIPLNTLEGQIVDVVRSTVVDNQSVLTEWNLPFVHPEKVAQFDLYRSTDNNNFTYLQSVPALQTDFMDYNVDVQHEHYYYKILVVNTCDIAEALSGNTSTIILKGEMNELRQVHLDWTSYDGWDNGVEYYILEKKDSNGHWQTLKQVDGSTLFYDYHE